MTRLRSLGNEIVLGTLIALLSVLTALTTYQGSIADSKQNEYELRGMQKLNDGNAEYLNATQFIVYDYNVYDGYFISDPESFNEQYYLASFSEHLNNALAVAKENESPFSGEYYDSWYATANQLWEEANVDFELAAQWDNRGDALQLVALIMAVGLAFAAWASLLKEESNMRVVFSLLAIITFVVGLLTYWGAPEVLV
jgi:hypothetical protein